SSGDGEVTHHICLALARAERDVSRRRSHNSGPTAPAGYWSIATEAREPSTSLCAYEGSFAAGLLEAGLQVTAGQRPVLLVAYDAPYPPPLNVFYPMVGPFGVGFVLSPTAGATSLGSLELTLAEDGDETKLPDPALESLRRGVAAARRLPWRAGRAGGGQSGPHLGSLPGANVVVAAAPCAPPCGGAAG